MSEYISNRVQGLGCSEFHVSVEVVGMYPDLSDLFHQVIHVAYCSCQYRGVLGVDMMPCLDGV